MTNLSQDKDGHMSQTNNETDLYKKLDDYIDSLPEKQGALITVLHEAQEIFGYLPAEVQNHVAKRLDVPASKVYGVVSFYSFFSMTKKGKYRVAVCMGTACFVRGASKILEKFEKELHLKTGTTSEDGMWSIDSVRCVGACGLAPLVTVNGKFYGRLTEKDVPEIIDECLAAGGNS